MAGREERDLTALVTSSPSFRSRRHLRGWSPSSTVKRG